MTSNDTENLLCNFWEILGIAERIQLTQMENCASNFSTQPKKST